LKETGVGTDDTCPQGSLSLLDHKVEVAVTVVVTSYVRHRILCHAVG
jgi:hypothetical protein